MFNISRATESDIPVIIDLAEKTWWATYSRILSQDQIRYMLGTLYAPDTLREQIAGGYQIYVVGADENGAQAFASYGQRVEVPSVYKLHKLYVLPENQGKGYGIALIKHIRQKLLEANIRTLELNVNRLNPALNFYIKAGFSIVGQQDIPIGPYWMNDYVMRLNF